MNKKLVFLSAYLGWSFDAMDALIYALVLDKAFSSLIEDKTLIGFYGGIGFSLFLIGWAIGGIVFGYIGDKLGRTRALIYTILFYSIFTAFTAFSQNIFELIFFRFLTAIGVGGEWAAGASLVAEVWDDKNRVKMSALLQSAWSFGFFIAAVLYYFLIGYGWRVLFLAGAFPAILTLFLRKFIKEPELWEKEKERARSVSYKELFSKTFLKITLGGSALAFIAVFGLWGATNWTPSIISSFDIPKAEVKNYVFIGSIILNLGALLGYASFGFLADFLGRKKSFSFMALGAFLSIFFTFFFEHSFLVFFSLLFLVGFFTNGIFSFFPIYFTEIFPTYIRVRGAGFCFNVGRVLAASGPFLTGYLSKFFVPSLSVAFISSIYLLSFFVLPFLPETKLK